MSDLTHLSAAVRASTRRWNQASLWLEAALLPMVAMLALWFARQGDEFSIMAGLMQGTIVWSVIDIAELRYKAGSGAAIIIPRWILSVLASIGIVLVIVIIFCVKNQIVAPWWFSALAGMSAWFAGSSIRQLFIAPQPKAPPRPNIDDV